MNAYVVLVDGASIKSCTLLAVLAEGTLVLTIEGLANGNELHPMQAAFREHHGLQCGFCTPGMVMNAIDLAKRVKNPGEQQIRQWLEQHLPLLHRLSQHRQGDQSRRRSRPEEEIAERRRDRRRGAGARRTCTS